MSFSGEVKRELCEQISPARHCQLAELSAIITFCGKIVVDKEQNIVLKLQTENISLTKKIFRLLKKLFQFSAEFTTKSLSNQKNLYELLLSGAEVLQVLTACKLIIEKKEQKIELFLLFLLTKVTKKILLKRNN